MLFWCRIARGIQTLCVFEQDSQADVRKDKYPQSVRCAEFARGTCGRKCSFFCTYEMAPRSLLQKKASNSTVWFHVGYVGNEGVDHGGPAAVTAYLLAVMHQLV